MKKILKLIIVIVILFVHNSSAGASLWWTEKMISLRFDVDHISHQQLQALLPIIDDNILLFDVRRAEEYQMSRIKGSILIVPDMSAQDFITQYGKIIQNKTLIFYCSVGYRSSEFIQRIEKNTHNKKIKAMYNLKGGIFRWYNEHHPVMNNTGETNDMHPSDESWADLINKR